MTSSINDDSERSRYRQEYNIARANAIGDFVRSIDEVLTGPSAGLICSSIRDLEIKELTQRAKSGDWQYECQRLLYDVLSMFKLEHNDLGTKSALRNWFSAFVLLRNKTKGHGAPRFDPCSEACPKLEESINIITSNLYIFKRTWVNLRRNVSGKYRLSFLTEDLRELDYLKTEKKHEYSDGLYCIMGELRKIKHFYTNPELTDFYISNGNLKEDRYECISYITDEKAKYDARDFLTPPSVLPSSHTEGKTGLDLIGNCFCNLPVVNDQYIERKELEAELIKVLKERERFPIITLLGNGGIGKTTLALNVLAKIVKEKRFSLIVWFSSRDIDLLMEGPKLVKSKVLTIEDIAEEYINLIGQETKADKKELFAQDLTNNKIGDTLYVFDNFETINNPVEVYEWINTYIRNPNKILITSRISRNFKADYPIEIKGMTEEECRNLIDMVGKEFGIMQILSSSYKEDLINESSGHPYIIKILLGEIAKSGKEKKINRIVAGQERLLDALFKRTFNTLSPSAKRVFLTLCSWNSLVPVVAVKAILWRPENEKMDVENAIEELRKSSFIDVIQGDTESDEYINVPLAASIFGKVELDVYHEKLKVLKDREFLMEFGASNICGLSINVVDRIDKKFFAVAKRVNSIEELKKEMPVLSYLASKHPSSYEHIVSFFEEYSDYESVKYYIKEHIKVEADISIKAGLWKKLAHVCQTIEDWEGEIHALFEVANLPGINFSEISNVINRLNKFFYNNSEKKQKDSSKQTIKKLINTVDTRLSECNATDLSRYAWLLLNDNQKQKAYEMVKKGLALEPGNDYCQKINYKLINDKEFTPL